MSTIRMKLELEQVGYGIMFSKSLSLSEDEIGWQSYEVATATADQAIAFNLTTGVAAIDIVLITSDYQISYRQAVTDTAITLDAGCVHVLWGTDISALLLTNASGSTALVKIFIAGT